MAFHSDALNGDSGKAEETRFISSFKSALAVIATIGFLIIVQPDLAVVFGAAAVTSLSLTFVSLLQSANNWARSTPKLDAIYAVLLGMMAIVSFQLAAGSLIGTVGILAAIVVAELIVSVLIAAGVSSLRGMYASPLGVALNVHSRLFGLLGRAA